VNYSVGDEPDEYGPRSVCCGDLDGDDDLDLAVANYTGDNISILLNNGNGTYATAVHYSADNGCSSVCAGDLDGDNDLDLVVTNSISDNVSVLLGNGNGTFAAAINYRVGDTFESLCWRSGRGRGP